ncbi:hypothetical protein TDB9533_03828 [Thalassocella blandensis]|nr:hypothetical protein TDB9533_03828 [Thalassocella blandensis]
MTDKSWMLNPKAIRCAKECISIIQEERGLRLKLSQPDFLQIIHEILDQTQSRALGDCYAKLISMAGVGFVMQNLKAKNEDNKDVVPMKKAAGAETMTLQAPHATVEHYGKVYPKYRAGLAFKGVYRGQPMYS